MKHFLFFLSVIIPISLLPFGVKIVGTSFFTACALLLIFAELGYTSKQFRAIGRGYNIDVSDAFWLSAGVNAILSFAFLAVLTWYGWQSTEGFSNIPYAYVPFAASFSYCCLLGAILCGLRLKMNHWIGKTSIAQTWCFLIMALSLIACVVYAIGNMYFEMALPEEFLNVNYAILWLCCIGIAVCGYRITILHRD